MNKIFNKFKKALLLGISGIILFLIFIVDIIRQSVDIEIGWIVLMREILIIIAFFIFFLILESMWKREQTPSRKLGFALVLSLVAASATAMLFIISPSGFEVKNAYLLPLGFDSVVLANLASIVLGISMLMIFMILRDILFSKRRKGTKRNFIILTILITIQSLSSLLYKPMEVGMISTILNFAALAAILWNSFRVSWIVYLTKREKILSIIYGFLLFLIFIGFDVVLARGQTIVGQSILFYSPPLQTFVKEICLFASIYFGMTFISTLFHLPTAEAFDRKISEVSSLHNLSKLVTQVFDFDELMETVTAMTLQVCEAKSAWLEMIPLPSNHAKRIFNHSTDVNTEIEIAGLKNISQEETQKIMEAIKETIRHPVLDNYKPIIIDSIRDDKRTRDIPKSEMRFSSMAVVPLVSHEHVIGILYATKDVEFGFDKDDIDVISAFADQATIAIENSRLIEKSIERERLMREMMLAQEMQRKLLPQRIPQLKNIELEALSTPAFEVGGDYYDFLMIDEHHLGILVGDVSGKGVSAAFYMAEMKGIFQALSKIYREPREFLIEAQRALIETIDKRSFISVVYSVVNVNTGLMKI
ncbi:MAG: SpoIIE family protein phosphatase, partial [Ignavibacteriales bacterium]|nr:SpoIIE family protein phosphatase [Ignavibacteriales bacterium]